MKNKDVARTSEAPALDSAVEREKFSPEFRAEAVRRLREGSIPATQLAFELGIRRNLLYKWAKKLEQNPAGTLRSPGRPPASEESEVTRLRRQLAAAEMELAILKKFDAYLTRQKK